MFKDIKNPKYEKRLRHYKKKKPPKVLPPPRQKNPQKNRCVWKRKDWIFKTEIP